MIAPQHPDAPITAHPPEAPALAALCTWMDAALAAQRAPGRTTGGMWNAHHVQLDFEPQAHTTCRQVLTALPFLATALGVDITGESHGDRMRLNIALATRKTERSVRALPPVPARAPAVIAEMVDLPVTAPTPAIQPANAPLTRGSLLEILYTADGRELATEPVDDLDCGLLAILVAHTLQHPVQWADPLAKVGRFVQVAYQPIGLPDPELIVALTPSPAFQAALRRFQAVRAKAPTWGWLKWYRDALAAARELVAPLQALRPTPAEARFVLRWAALAAATGNRGTR